MLQTVTHTGMVDNLTEGVLSRDVLMKYIRATYRLHSVAVYACMLGIICLHDFEDDLN